MPKLCVTKDCKKTAYYGEDNTYPNYCTDHKLINMIHCIYKVCEHNVQKSRCKKCNGSGICIHNIIKIRCKQCKGSQICEHNKHKYYCKEFKGSAICDHNKIKSYCKDCKGTSICIHNKRKEVCVICDGSQICEHYKRKQFCIEYKGSQICDHKKLKSYCKDCGGKYLCKTPLCETKKRNKYDGYCAFCYYNLFPDKPNSKNYKTKERTIIEFIMNIFLDYTWITDKKIENGCSYRRPDLLLDLGYQVIVIEIDETQHRNYIEICNNRRTMEISKDLNHRPIIFIRFNPDAYRDKSNKLINSCWKIDKKRLCSINKKYQDQWIERLSKLKSTIEFWCNENNKSEKTIEVIYLFFDEYFEENTSQNSEINIEETNQNIISLI